MLASDLQKNAKVFERNYDYIWSAIRAEAKKAVS
jgi:hypothetical protein